jgi:acid phosphatase
VSSSYPTTNYGTGTTIRVDGSPDVHSYLRFAVSGLNGATVSSAELRIYANSASSAGVAVDTVSDNTWGETTITYANMPALGSSINTSAAVVSATWVSIDVTSYVKGEGSFDFGLLTPGATAISLASRESGANAPQLVLTLGSGTASTPTAGPSSTGTASAPSPTNTAPAPTATNTGTAPAPTPTSAPTSGPAPASGPIQHVFVLWMENKGYSQVWNTSSTPYITSLGQAYTRATNFYAITHPSLPNYLTFFGGSNYGITTDCSPSSSCHINAKSLADTLEAKGLSWKFYQESMPSPCYITTSGNYAPKHNPAVYFDDVRTNSARCTSKDVGFGAFATDLASASTTPNFSFITPNLCSDMHSCSISTGDNWLKSNVPSILNSPACTVDKCLLILTWDEDNGSYGNHVLTIFAGSAAKTGGVTSGVKYTHYSALRTVEYIFGLPTLTSNDGNASPMTDMLR